jgi:hypothetical protein
MMTLQDGFLTGAQMLLSWAAAAFLLVHAGETLQRDAQFFLACALACFGCGDLFFFLHVLLRGAPADAFSASDIAWIGSYCFLCAVHRALDFPRSRPPVYAWLAAAACAAVFVLLIALYGDAVINILWGVPMVLLSWTVGVGLQQTGRTSPLHGLRPYYAAQAVLLGLNLALFLSWGTLYLVLDGLLTITLIGMSILFYRGVRKRSEP